MDSKWYLPHTDPYKQVIQSIWQVERLTVFQTEQIIPKGIVEIIFNFSSTSPILAQLEGKQYHLSHCFINGFNTAPLQLQLPQQQVFFGVVFQPLAVKKILGIPAGEFSDMLVDLTLIDSNFHTLWLQLAEQHHFDDRVSVFLAWVGKKIFTCQPQEKQINNFLSAVNVHDLSVKNLADAVCYSPRHLSRKILEATGMNTEEILLYKKYLHAVHLMHSTDLSLTEIAYQSRFSDQSHFIKTFKAHANMTPGAYRRSKSAIKGHIDEVVR